MKDHKDKNEENSEESPVEQAVNGNSVMDLENLNSRIKELEAQLSEEKNAKLIALAEFQNYRKRLESDKNDYKIFATKLIMGQLMQIVDDFVRANKDLDEKLNEVENKDEVKGIIKMLNDKVEMIILQNGFEEIKIKVGDDFNHETMEALTTVPLEEKEKKNDGKVVHIDQIGFRHIESGLVFKTAKVIIGKFNK